ncbi:HAD family hydrolase [Nonomuraea endophytica]|uniref:Phosphoglycolate phosphatase-like HAD superfamily hydrolase n=1 Tax=Nonomuraea endophytica TaxID=714136 RepID=A0A7W8AG36_9ACTN|nr:HAD-IA family hydrolase [Nonomuraea endophytica]MBB5084123.1 phosphoglycolate phosphatase-like HAD superfamily hydrolase [Nonomuraea endophytica]
MIRAVVIDVDDTLCLTEAACFELENEVLACIGREPMSRDVHLSTWGQPLLEAMTLRSPGIDLEAFAAAYPAVLRRYVADGRLDVVAQENLQALDALAAAGRSLMLLTSRTEAEVEHLLAPDHALTGRLAAVYHAGNMRYSKPDARAFDELLAATGLDPRHCLYVGDSPGDAHAANGAGLRFIACMQSGVRRRADFADHHVDAFIDTFPQMVEAVARLENTRS